MDSQMSEVDILRKNVNDLQNSLNIAQKRIAELTEELKVEKTKNLKLDKEVEALAIDLAFYKDEIGGTGA
jgi:chromosome segregation ATPase